MPASTPWWSTPSIAAPRPGRRPTLGLAAAIVASVLSGVAMADPPPSSGPPPWAPAHGWRAKHQPQPYYAIAPQPYAVYAVPYGINHGTCDRGLLSKELIGGVIGGVAGGAAGTQIGKGKGQMVATAGGALIGVLVGSTIGRSMDQVDQSCVGRVLEYAPDRSPVHWYGAGGTGYAVTPLNTFERDGRYCREYQTTAQIGGQNERVYGTACRMPDGAWQIVS